jgi:predicted XRE-type DNA-binding protein
MAVEFLYQNTPLPGMATVKAPSAGGFSITKNGTYRDELQFVLDSENNTFTPEKGEVVDVLEHTGAALPTRIFAGPIKAVNTTVIDELAQPVRRHVVTCADNSDFAHRILAPERVYVKQKLNDILRNLLVDQLGYGVTATTITPGEGPQIERLEIGFQQPTMAEVFDELISISGGGIWWIDEERDFRYQLGAPSTATFTIDDASDWIEIRTLALEESLENYANKLVVTAARYRMPEQTQSFSGSHPTQPTNGTRKQWILDRAAAAAPVITVNGVEKTVGIAGVDTGKDWYWSEGSRDIEQDEGAVALPNTATLAITYSGLDRAVAFVENAAEMTARGKWERHIDISGLVTQTELDQKAAALLAEVSQPTYVLRLTVAKFAAERPKPGDRIDINRTGYRVVSGLIVDQVQILPIFDSEPVELQRVVVARKGPKIADGAQLGAGQVSGSISSGGAVGVGSGAAFAWAPDATVSSGTATPNAASYTHFGYTVEGNFTLANPTGIRDAAPVEIDIEFDAVGGHTVTLGSAYGTLPDIIPQPNSRYRISAIGKGAGLKVLWAGNL